MKPAQVLKELAEMRKIYKALFKTLTLISSILFIFLFLFKLIFWISIEFLPSTNFGWS